MTLREQVLAQALLLAGELNEHQIHVLDALCTASSAAIASRLREGLTPNDCKADFIAAASLMALASLNGVDEEARVEQITAGDLVVKKRSRDAASNCLRSQAEMLMAPYLKDRFTFLGV